MERETSVATTSSRSTRSAALAGAAARRDPIKKKAMKVIGFILDPAAGSVELSIM
jgi:hypothetical protein